MLDINLVRSQLNIEPDFSEDDALIQSYIYAAIDEFNESTNRKLYAVGDALPNPIGNALTITKSIEQGALMLIGHWYNNRESVITGIAVSEIPAATKCLWARHRWVGI